MATYRFFPYIILGTALLLRADEAADSSSSVSREKVLHLDAVLVSAGADGKTAFDLAQGSSILTGDALHLASRATLGQTLADEPGVSATYHGPGASRPIIRGLGGDRVRILDNSVGAFDLSNISPDHNVAVEPLFASRVEVLRGPSTLLYGSSAVGGVVNVIDNRIPTSAGDGQLHGAAELRGFGAGDERAGVVAVGGGSGALAFQVDALRLRSDDISIPGVARVDPDAPADQPQGILPNSAIDTTDGSIGATYLWSRGHLGASVRRYETDYGVPNGEELPVQIRMRQTRYDLEGELTQPLGFFRSAKWRAGYGKYQHGEYDGEELGTTFHNESWETRLELTQEAIGNLTGTVGLQAQGSRFSADGEEVVTPPSRTGGQAIFALEEWKQGGVTYQIGGRLERQTVRLGEVDPDLPYLPGYGATSGRDRRFLGGSASAGVVVYPAKDYSVGFSLAYSERLPTAQELFSNGPHGGTDAYEVGTSGLKNERSLGVDLSLRRRAGALTGTVSAFLNRFSDYIFEQRLADSAIAASANPDGLAVYQFVAKDALFYGAEAEVNFHLVDTEAYRVHLDLLGDVVHAEQTSDNVPLPRMPPWRLGLRLRYEDTRWHIGAEVRHAGRQDRVAPGETVTDAYTLVNADVSYALAYGRFNYEVFARGDNLFDQEARVATSFLKDLAPLPGRGVTLGVRIAF